MSHLSTKRKKMNELFHLAQADEDPLPRQINLGAVPDTAGNTIQQLRFNGNCEAFVAGNFVDFCALLQSGNVIWLSQNMLACAHPASRSLLDALRDKCQQNFELKFAEHGIAVVCVKGPTHADTKLFDMLLQSQRRLFIGELTVRSKGGPRFRFHQKHSNCFLRQTIDSRFCH
jgi:hypothetical protein